MTNLVLWVSVLLSWAASDDPQVGGYNLYVGRQSGSYERVVFIPAPRTTARMTVLRGTTNYFALTAVWTNGVESLPTPELVMSSEPPMIRMILESSGDLNEWLPVGPIATWTVTVPDSADRFYRGRVEFR